MTAYRLSFVAFDPSENCISNARHTVSFEFGAESDEQAREQARQIWLHEQLARRSVGWDGIDYPRGPVLARLVDFDSEAAEKREREGKS